MKVLVAVASKHGATKEIADTIGDVIAAELSGSEVHVLYAEGVTSVSKFDGVILGSAVYMGRWLESARNLAEVQRAALLDVPVWLFSSGPVGEQVKPGEDPAEVAELVSSLKARGHHLFGGKIDRSTLRFPERAVVAALRVKDGDYRDWPVIRSWGKHIAAELTKTLREASA